MQNSARALLLALTLTPFQAANAGDTLLSWTPPTQSQTCTAGPPVPDIASYSVYQLVATIDDPDAESFEFEDLPPGDYVYAVTVTTVDGLESHLSNRATKTVESFLAPAGSQVYQTTTISSGFWMISMGTLTADTACDAGVRVTSGGRDYYRVPQDSVEWNAGATARPQLLVAECG